VAEWSIAPVLKTGNGQPFVSSNLTASASLALSQTSHAVLVVGFFVAQFLSSMALRAAVRSTAAQKAVNHMATDA
jgi:hypothetical protein